MGEGDFAALIKMLFAAYSKTPTDDEIVAYGHGLKDLSMRNLTFAIRKAIQTERFLPTPAVIRSMCMMDSKDRALLAWEAVLKNLPLGAYKSVSFDDPITNATIRTLGGWPTFLGRFKSSEDEKWTRKEFLDTYASLMKSKVTGEICRALPGLGQAQVVIDKDGRRVLAKPIPRIIQTGLPDLPRLTDASPKKSQQGVVAGLIVKKVEELPNE